MRKRILAPAFFLILLAQADGADQIEAPKTVDEAMGRLEKLLGRYTQQDNRQWRFVIDDELRTTPEPGKPLAVVRKGILTYGVALRSGDLITFDSNQIQQRTIYDVKAGERTLSRKVQTDSCERYSLRRTTSGEWFFDAVFLSHSIPEFRDRPYQSGRVIWLADGIELVGFGTDEFFRQGGKLEPGAFVGRRKLARTGDQLIEAYRSQNYELAKSPDGDVLPMPDLTKPVGEPFKHEIKSEPLKGDSEL
ncbi:MAG: hypothetical protein JWN86_1339 [Planctomycetota bacterium]|nr:hypothetical protein [Planctomycetota bacterium]